MSYTVLITFEEVQRIYAKGTVQTFGEWTDEEKAVLIPKLEALNWIVPDVAPVEPDPAPEPIPDPQPAVTEPHAE